MVRDATFTDIPAIRAVMRHAYTRSVYAQQGLCGFDEKEANRLLVNAIQRHGSKNGGFFVQVAETRGEVTGFIVGHLSRVYLVGDRLMASDLFWLSAPWGDARGNVRLMRNMVEWAKAHPLVIEIRCGTTAILQEPERAGRILQRLGMQPYGKIYRMEVA